MADKKISALTGASTPLAGTEVLPIVQSGSTVKVSVDNLTTGKAVSGTQFTASTGNFIVGTAGKGITTGGSFDLGLGANGSTTAVYVNTSNKLLINTTSNAFSGYALIRQTVSADDTLSLWNSATTGDNVLITFFTDGGSGRGSITYNRGLGQIAYNITSDYRAKDIIGPVQNPGVVIDALKVYTAKMKGATVEAPMLIAHEAQAVVPYCVTGDKDAVNADGSPKYQQMDVSSLVPLLLAEIQMLRVRVSNLEQR